MKFVNIAKFKTELGKYIGYIRRGEEIVVLDRSQPLARVLPFKQAASKLFIEEPVDKNNNLSSFHFKPIANKKIDSLKFLTGERGER
jgi:antitoxin (DNA-binding transcriptional repressor) of toxin-antitoxin stability system